MYDQLKIVLTAHLQAHFTPNTPAQIFCLKFRSSLSKDYQVLKF